MTTKTKNKNWLRRFSKLVCLGTFFLIFAGGMVTSTGSGLSVPDWPLSYGMWFPPMVGGVFYEHGHRMIAATIGFLTLILTIWICFQEKRKWVRNLSLAAFGAVVLQGLLGGMTVLHFLPDSISISHAVLAQTFFILTIFIAYSLSKEREARQGESPATNNSKVLMLAVTALVLIYAQLLLGAIMRHTDSGLAIPDFPLMSGQLIPSFNSVMLDRINDWRFDMDLPPVEIKQVLIHFFHRMGAIIVACAIWILSCNVFKSRRGEGKVINSVFLMNILLLMQIFLGAMTVLTQKSPVITSLHVVVGAGLLATGTLTLLRISPLTLARCSQVYKQTGKQ